MIIIVTNDYHCQIKEMIGEADKDDSGAVDFGEILVDFGEILINFGETNGKYLFCEIKSSEFFVGDINISEIRKAFESVFPHWANKYIRVQLLTTDKQVLTSLH